MKRKQVYILGLMVVMTMSCLMNAVTSELRSPLDLIRGPFHYPLPRVEEDRDWNLESWGALFGRTASKAYVCNECCPDSETVINKNVTTTHKVPLSTLFFGKSDFRGEEAFPGGILFNSGFPALSFVNISPRFDYNEWGIMVGLHACHDLGAQQDWRIGGRLILPFKIIEVEQSRGCGFEESGPEIDAALFEHRERSSSSSDIRATTYAYRFDVLNTLLQQNGTPMVQYGPTGVSVAGVQLAVDTNGLVDVGITPADGNGFPELKTTPGEDPAMPHFGIYNLNEKAALITLPANGATTSGNRYFFRTGIAYGASLGTNREAQSQLFLVPAMSEQTDIEINAAIVYNAVQDAIAALDQDLLNSAVNVFREECCIDFCQSDRTVGVGDLDAEMYIGRQGEDGFANLIAGVRFPTGKKITNVRKLLDQPTGNNGHFEMKVGAEVGFQPIYWCAFKFDAFYNHVFRHNEKRAAPFAGATVINIGPCVNADMEWNWIMAHADINFFHPKNDELGLTIGYEFYDKRCDKVCICQKTATPCITGVASPLDVSLLTANTSRRSHKIRGEVFNRFYYWELFAGGSYIVAGKNIMNEAQAHIGVTIYF